MKLREQHPVLKGLCLALVQVLTANASDWPQWRGPNRNGAWNESGLLDSFATGKPQLRWSIPVGWGWSSPVVFRGRVFITCSRIEDATGEEQIFCIEAKTGRKIWSYSYDAGFPDYVFKPGQERGPASTPVISEGKILEGFG